jgi:uncharacterized protein YqjF (DUF2071 family)
MVEVPTQSRQPAPFLTAVWSDLLMFTFAVPDAAVQGAIPEGTEPDRWEGSALASVVAFDFTDTRVRGVGFPRFRNFPEWNLRVYARHGEDRGVSFVREFVPSRAVASIARALYNEPYGAARFVTTRTRARNDFGITHRMRAEGAWHAAGVTCRAEPTLPPAGSLETFLKEQAWGFCRSRAGRLRRYRVEHPPWRVFPVEDWLLEVDFLRLYGPEWAFLQGAAPINILCAEGSPIRVYPRR